MSATAEKNAIQERPPELVAGGKGIIPRNIDEMFRLANAAVRGGFAPKGMTAEGATIAIQYGLEIGFMPMQALQSIAVINGRPSLFGDALPALILSSGKCESFDEWFTGQEDTDNWTAHCKTIRRGVGNPIERKFSVADAKRSGLWGKQGPWQQYPQRMLQMRARAWCFRDAYADVLRGMCVSEEAYDMPPRQIESVVVTEKTGSQRFSEALAAVVGKHDPEPPADNAPSEAEQAEIKAREKAEYEAELAAKSGKLFDDKKTKGQPARKYGSGND